MATTGGAFKVTVDKFEYTKLQGQLYDVLGRPRTRAIVAQTLIDKSKKYIPVGETGNLRESGYVKDGDIYFGKGGAGPYAHYQWYGKVMGPNRLFQTIDKQTGRLKKNSAHWRTPKGVKKFYTGRNLGVDRMAVFNTNGSVSQSFNSSGKSTTWKGKPAGGKIFNPVMMKFGYTGNKHAHANWVQYAWDHDRRSCQIEITKRLKKYIRKF